MAHQTFAGARHLSLGCFPLPPSTVINLSDGPQSGWRVRNAYKSHRFYARAINSLQESTRQGMQTTTVSAEGVANPRHPTPRSSDDVELSILARKVSAGDPGIAMKQASTITHTDDTVDQTKAQRLRARIQFATLCWTLYLAGWNDGSTGPLLPRIQKVYHVGTPVIVHGAELLGDVGR